MPKYTPYYVPPTDGVLVQSPVKDREPTSAAKDIFSASQPFSHQPEISISTGNEERPSLFNVTAFDALPKKLVPKVGSPTGSLGYNPPGSQLNIMA